MTSLAVSYDDVVEPATPRAIRPVADGDPGGAAIEALERDGVVCLKAAFDVAWVELLRQAVDISMLRVGENSFTVAVPGEAGVFFSDNFMWKRIPEFRRFVFESPAADLAMKLLRSRTLTFYFDFLLVKQAGASSATPWHQDHSYWPVKGSQICNIWTALDVIPKDTGLRFVKGSHRYQTLYRAVSFDPRTRHPEEIMERPLPPDFDAGEAGDGETGPQFLSWDMAPGDSLVWYSRTFHSAPGNFSTRRRAALSTSWFGDDVTYAEIPLGTGPTSRGENLVEGGPMTCETFPRVR
jgi:ectoine hydroxylase-related dioxygenase (phytanoyl-CoA dioxygenase family)